VAFGTERLRHAVETLSNRVNDAHVAIRTSLTETRDAVVDAVTRTRTEVAGTIDAVRSDLGDRVDATHRNVDALTRDLGAARREIAELHALLQGWRAEAAEAREAARDADSANRQAEAQDDTCAAGSSPVAAGPAPAPCAAHCAEGEYDDGHLDLLRAAAGISEAEFTCHRDLWAYFLRKAGNEPHFHIPGAAEDEDGDVHVRLSGPTLVAALTAMWEVRSRSRRENPAGGDWALAEELYHAVAAAVATVLEVPRHRDRQKVAIVIDRRPQGDAAGFGSIA
jgi:hypothetical protein